MISVSHASCTPIFAEIPPTTAGTGDGGVDGCAARDTCLALVVPLVKDALGEEVLVLGAVRMASADAASEDRGDGHNSCLHIDGIS